MRDLDGRYAQLNLGPLHAGSGGFLPLDLGTEWSDGPGPEPIPKALHAGCWVPWSAVARTIRRVSSTTWGRAGLVAAQGDFDWTTAGNISSGHALAWGLSELLGRSLTAPWRTVLPRALAAHTHAWSFLGRERSAVSLHWQGSMRARRTGLALGWHSAPRTDGGANLSWLGRPANVGADLQARWLHPGISRRGARLPWGPAKAVPWRVVPPGTTPDPDPDPEPTWPEGNYVGLNLGCLVMPGTGLAPLNLGVSACYMVRPQRRTYVVINSISVVRLPDRMPIEVESVSISSSVDAWGSSFDVELANVDQLALLKPTAAGPSLVEITLNGYVWTTLVESYGRRREWSRAGVTLAGRSRTALLAAPYAPGRVKTTTEDRSAAQLVAEELVDTGFAAGYDTVDWVVPAGAWFYDATPALDAISRLAEASGAVVQSHPADASLRVRPRYPHSPWDWHDRTPDHVIQEDIVSNESLQIRSAPLYDAVVVTGELAGKGVTCKVRRAGEAGQLFAQQVSSPLINTSAVAAERGRNVLADRGEQAAIDLVLPLFAGPLRPGEVGRILPLDLVEIVGEAGTWNGLCTAVRTEARISDKAAVIEQTITLERHYTDAD